MVANHSGTTLETENRNNNSTKMEPNSYDSALNTNPDSKSNGQQKEQKETLMKAQEPQQYCRDRQPQKMAPTVDNKQRTPEQKHFHTYRYVNTMVGHTLKPYETWREKELWEKGKKDTGTHYKSNSPETIDLTNDSDDEETEYDSDTTAYDSTWDDGERRVTRVTPSRSSAGNLAGHLDTTKFEANHKRGVVEVKIESCNKKFNGNRNGNFNTGNVEYSYKNGDTDECKISDDPYGKAYDITHPSFIGSIWYCPKPTPIYAYPFELIGGPFQMMTSATTMPTMYQAEIQTPSFKCIHTNDWEGITIKYAEPLTPPNTPVNYLMSYMPIRQSRTQIRLLNHPPNKLKLSPSIPITTMAKSLLQKRRHLNPQIICTWVCLLSMLNSLST
jgi:hypothetical protein